MTEKYVVTIGTPGYLPNTVEFFSNKREAQQFMTEEKRQHISVWSYGNRTVKAEGSAKCGLITIKFPDSMMLPVYIELSLNPEYDKPEPITIWPAWSIKR